MPCINFFEIVAYIKKYSRGGTDAVRKLKTYRACGASLMALDIAMCAAVTQMVLSERTVVHEGVMIFVSAMYTFYKAITAVTNLVKARNVNDPIVQSLRNVNIADALISVISLETAMLASFGQGEDLKALQALTGFAVCAITVAIGIIMIIRANSRLKKLSAKPPPGDQP